MTPRRRWSGTVAIALLLAGCADRGIVSGPPDSTGAGTWIAVGTAATAAALVLAALLVLPAARPGGSAFAAGLLAIQAGAAIVGGAVLLGAAVRGGQLVDRAPDAEQAASLLRLSGLDGGDTGFFWLVAVLTVLLGSLVVAVLVLSARFAADTDPLERTLACCVLAIEALISGVAVVLGLLGHHSLPFALTAAALPALVLAIVKCWPHRDADELDLGYNG
ncbi:MAG: hypothetical protein ABL966_11635 [Acidimicrobiales bacterium]